jgi:MraZ protein
MKQQHLSGVSLAVVLLCATGTMPAMAHHSRAAFDLLNKSEIKARITEVRWTNPHVFLVGQVTNAQGQTEEWTFEGHSISGLSHAGWTRDTVKKGDELLLVVNRHRDTAKHFALMDHVILPDGTRVYSVGVPPTDPSKPKPALQASSNFSGNWKLQFPGTPEQQRERIAAWPANARAWQRILLGSATDVDMDSAGRILVSPELRSAAMLTRDVMLLGLGNRFEVWDAGTLSAREAEALTGAPPDAVASFAF